MLVVGPRDAEQGTVSVRDRIDGDVGAMTVAEAIAKFQTEEADRTVRQSFDDSAGFGDGDSVGDY